MKDRVPIATLLNEALDLTGYDAVLLADSLANASPPTWTSFRTSPHRRRNGAIDLDDFITQLAAVRRPASRRNRSPPRCRNRPTSSA